ncbi:MAG: hypothetical protein AB1446_08765 [Bacillota bacterium]
MRALVDLDRRWIFLAVFVLIAIVVIFPLGLPVRVTPMTKAMYDYVDKLPPGSVLWLGLDYGPSVAGELNPQLEAVVHHAFRKNLRIITYTMWNTQGTLGRNIIQKLMKEYNKEYGKDWVDLGFKPGGDTNLRLMTSSIKEAAAGVDYQGKSLDEFPLTREVKALDKPYVAFIIDFPAGSPGAPQYLAIVTEVKGVPMGVGQIQMSVADSMQFVHSGQYKGMIPGLRGAAEYEQLVGKPAAAVRAMDGQTLAAGLVGLLIILGNVIYLTTRSR